MVSQAVDAGRAKEAALQQVELSKKSVQEYEAKIQHLKDELQSAEKGAMVRSQALAEKLQKMRVRDVGVVRRFCNVGASGQMCHVVPG